MLLVLCYCGVRKAVRNFYVTFDWCSLIFLWDWRVYLRFYYGGKYFYIFVGGV